VNFVFEVRTLNGYLDAVRKDGLPGDTLRIQAGPLFPLMLTCVYE